MDDTFWIENFGSLFSSVQIIPLSNMSTEEQLNSISRLIFIIYVIMLLFEFKYSIEFIIISLLFIIIIYYIQRSAMKKRTENFTIEYYTPPTSKFVSRTQLGPPVNASQFSTSKVVGNRVQTIVHTDEILPFCNDEINIDQHPQFSVGMNQRLSTGEFGGTYHANPNTLKPPVVAPPSWDLEYWRDNNLVNNSYVNKASAQEDMYSSGYAISTCCGYLGDDAKLVPEQKQKIETVVGGNIENYNRGRIVSPLPAENVVYAPSLERFESGRIVSPLPAENVVYAPSLERFDAPLTTQQNRKQYAVQPNQSGWVNTTCGYNPSQVFDSGLPSNYPASNCEQDSALKQYNQNLHTQIVTPGVYTRNQVNEPINSNIGISFQQQFEPVTCHRDEKGLHFLQHDPRIIEPAIEEPITSIEEKATSDNVYDPRFYGYGTSYRSYIEPVTGQPRFMYDDINAIRMPNYIVRSKIDHLPYADSYGPVQAGSEFGNVHNPHIRALVQDSWMRDSLQFRDDITTMTMRKINSEAWQRRQAPLGPHTL